MPPRQGAGATFPSAATGEKQGQLTCSHDFLDLGPVFPIATGGEGWGGRRASPQHTHHLMTHKEPGQPFFALWGQVTHTHALRLVYSYCCYQVQLHCNDWARYKSYSALQRAANSEKQGQLYKTLHLWRMGSVMHSSYTSMWSPNLGNPMFSSGNINQEH